MNVDAVRSHSFAGCISISGLAAIACGLQQVYRQGSETGHF